MPNDQIQHNKKGSEQYITAESHYVIVWCTQDFFFQIQTFLLVLLFFYTLVDRYASFVITLLFTTDIKFTESILDISLLKLQQPYYV